MAVQIPEPIQKLPEAGRALTRLLSGRRSVLVLVMIAIGACQLLIPNKAVAQTTNPQVVVAESECKVKYVYLYSFGLLTKWPEATFERTNNAFVIGVLGDKPFGHILDAIARRKEIDNRRIVIRRFKSMKEYQPCHILYVTESVSEEDATSAANDLNDDAVLIVGETEDFQFIGGVIAFRIEDENVKFSLNVDAVKRRHLMVSARLSRLALTVRDTDRRRPVSTAENR
jgi:hypothetical protein